jgi:pimeloyl-ACP methyl ester carboxylesterase
MTSPFDGPPSDEDLTLSIRSVAAAPPVDDGSMALQIHTTRGTIQAVFHPVEGGTGAVVFVGGAMGGLNGPANEIYRRLPEALAKQRISSLRVEYRQPNDLQECVLDVLGACSFLKGIGASDVVLVGHSFGGAVVISAAELAPIVRGVVSMSAQLHGTSRVEHLTVPLLLIHGMADTVLGYEASEDIYRRANEPRRIVLYGEAGHSLVQASEDIWDLLLEWLPERLDAVPMEGGREEHQGPHRAAEGGRP